MGSGSTGVAGTASGALGVKLHQPFRIDGDQKFPNHLFPALGFPAHARNAADAMHATGFVRCPHDPVVQVFQTFCAGQLAALELDRGLRRTARMGEPRKPSPPLSIAATRTFPSLIERPLRSGRARWVLPTVFPMTTSTWLLHHPCGWLTYSDATNVEEVCNGSCVPPFKPFCSSQHLNADSRQDHGRA